MAVKVEQLITQHLDLWTQAQTAKSTAGRGSNNKIELTGIKKLRELILELAVRGKLVPQDPNDEPANELLKRIATEKEALVKAGKLKKQKPFLPISDEEKPFELPVGWEWSRLGSLGWLTSSSRVHQKDWTSTGIPFYRTREIVSLCKFGSVENELFISEELYQTLTETGTTPETNDVMLTGVGTIGVPYLVNQQDKFYFKDASVLIFKNVYNIEPEFFLHFFKSPTWIEQIHNGSMGTTVHTLTIARGTEVLVPVPPITEQHAISVKIEELMALCDQLEQQSYQSIDAHNQLVDALLATLTQSHNAEELASNWQRLAAHFDTLFTTEYSINALKQSILQLAVMGKLCKQDPNDEPASELLKRIAFEKDALVKAGKIKKQKPLPPISDEEKPFELPEGWEWCRLGDLAAFQKGYAFKSENYLDSGVMITKIQNLTDNHIQNSVYIAPETVAEFDQYLLSEGDIVMTTVGSWFSAPLSAVGRTFMIRKLFDNSLLNQNAVKLRAWKGITPSLLLANLRSLSFKNYLFIEAQGTANQASITQESIKKFLLCLPPENEQNRIISKLDELMIICDALSGMIDTSKHSQSVLADALVEQVVA
ncbi:hypothetical protein VT06_13895 [Arsukibacterium sp. MJ3]|uniref:restriction endonuclease subunit S n=1 Tax=Arsukibacterium sp. MJ3 TaxID=1632859 RepID=UPI00062710F7|nr:restriction endonuclease subunit S [Arsukibacterium sp. MJ3]KKO47982.1 hypothetical protein VT06_13895 [Arsukibacterium sp. MJ3]